MKRMRQPNSAVQRAKSEGRFFTHSPVNRHSPLTTRPPSLATRHPSGFTLLEVLIATGILVFGVLAIIRIFPAGLGVIERNQNATTAARLAEDMNERFTRQKDQLPDAIIAVDASGGFITDFDPESTPDDPAPNSVDSMRRVVGEAHTVPSSGSVMVSFPAMVFYNSSDPDLQSPRVYRDVPLTQRDSSVSAALLGTDEFKEDTPGKLIFNNAKLNEYVRISYKWIDTDNTTNSRTYHVTNERRQVTNSSGLPAVSVAATAINSINASITFQAVVAGTISVTWEDASLSPASSPADEQLGGGVITGLTAGQDVKVDYTVADWRWFSEQTIVPSPTVKHPSTSADFNVSPVDLLFKSLNEAEKFYVVDESDGNAVEYANGSLLNPSTTEQTPVVDYRKGLIRLQVGTPYGVFTVGHSLRLTYKTADEWTVQMQKAPATFTDVTTSDTETYRQFADRYWQGGSDAQVLGFKQCNSGKTVVVDYVDTAGNAHYGELHVIGTAAATTPVYSAFPYEMKLHNNYREIVSVRGVSMTSRVLWIDKGTFRHVEVATYLARN